MLCYNVHHVACYGHRVVLCYGDNMKRSQAVDTLRVLAILGVILIHVTSRSLALGYYDIVGMPWTFFWERFGRFSVVLFFIISGYVLALRHKGSIDVKQFFLKRAIRLLVPYVIWCLIYAIYNYKSHLMGFSFNRIFDGSFSIQLYFIPVLFLLNVSFPFIKRIRFTKKVFLVYSFVEFFLLTVEYFHPIALYSTLKIALFSAYPFVIGMLTASYQDRVVTGSWNYRYYLIGLLVVFLYALYQSTFYLFLPHRDIPYIGSQLQPLIFIYGILVWLIALPFFQKHTIPFVPALSRLIFFVFFVHPLVLNLFWKIKGSYLYSLTQSHILYTWWYTPCVFLFVVIGSFGIGFALQRLPKINSIVGIS